ncbi:MAG: hypothetical protein V3U76_13960 [Granulosicoccus sp.]
MINEELYQQAAEELNSNRRKAHIWARACALASDDHDEARYLYTNLRVEEMLAEHDNGPSTPPLASAESVSIPPLALEPLDLDEDMLSSDATDDNNNLIASTRLGISSSDSGTSLHASELFDREDPEQVQRPSSERNRITLENEWTEDLDLDPSLLEQMNDSEETVISSIDGAPIKAQSEELKFHEIDNEFDLTIPDETAAEIIIPVALDEEKNSNIDFAEFEAIAEPETNSESRQSAVEELIDGLSKQASVGESSWGETNSKDTVPDLLPDASELPPAPDHSTSAFTEDLERQVEEFTEHHSAIDMPAAAGIAGAAALPSPDHGFVEPDGVNNTGQYEFGEPVEDNDATDLMDAGGSRLYGVYEHFDNPVQLVKQGLCWPALFVSLPWLLYRQLFGTAVAYTLLWLTALSGLIVTGLAWLDAGDQASITVKLVTLAFALLSVIGLLFIPFLYGNAWRARKLEKRGYELVAEVYAPNVTIARTHVQQRLGRA